MKTIITVLVLLGFICTGCSDQTTAEKIQVEKDSLQRSVNKTINRAEEDVCGTLTGENRVQCLAKKVKNRAEESADVVVDKASEIKGKVDSD